MEENKNELSFEDKIRELEATIKELEDGEVNLDDAIEKYSHYFDLMYGSNLAFTNMVDAIYEMYKSGMDVYLECYCAPLRCHGDIIKEKLEARLLKEKIKELMRNESSVQK